MGLEVGFASTCLSVYVFKYFYLKAVRVEAGVCPAANWSVSLNLHGIQQVLVTETRGPADLKLGLPNTAGTKVVELEEERGSRQLSVFQSY